MTVAERGSAPLVGALGGVIGQIAAQMRRDHGVDLRCGVGMSSLEGDAGGHVRPARLSDGTAIEADLVLASLGSIRDVEWLEGSGLAAGFWGVGCDAGGRAFDINGVATDRVYVAGDVARSIGPSSCSNATCVRSLPNTRPTRWASTTSDPAAGRPSAGAARSRRRRHRADIEVPRRDRLTRAFTQPTCNRTTSGAVVKDHESSPVHRERRQLRMPHRQGTSTGRKS
ncbi:FAD-dependent oxidoreductase [Nonomuraea sp. NPDC048881]|uniref:FAD-dependent oxidoreductase n=1 Tax=Nonomuraea sp. NPDC048881 TaxID=3155030 RepID=UPI00340137A7